MEAQGNFRTAPQKKHNTIEVEAKRLASDANPKRVWLGVSETMDVSSHFPGCDAWPVTESPRDHYDTLVVG